ncbi:MAG: hypothetical protein H5T69_16510 [Chloroflexi bacterium]|nr:hypothetical protein [Chloroflexota bacterium]
MKRIALIGIMALALGLVGAAIVVTALGGIHTLRTQRYAANEVAGHGWEYRAVQEAPTGRGYAGNAADRGRAYRGGTAWRSASTEHVWETIEGLVEEDMAGEPDLVLRLRDGQLVPVGTGPGWLTSQWVTLEKGAEIAVRGFWEGGEFKAAEITRLADGARITLRDENGQPMWAGQGRRANRG